MPQDIAARTSLNSIHSYANRKSEIQSGALPPWRIDSHRPSAPVPASADFAVIGAGFTGLAAAAWLRHLAPEKSVAVFDSASIGAGASGRTGGMALAETAAGDLPGLGDVLAGFRESLSRCCGVDCDLVLPGAWEIARSGGAQISPIEWKDSGRLRVVNEVPGGTLDPGLLVERPGPGRTRAESYQILENQPVTKIG